VFAALVEPEAIVRWKVPSGMTCVVHELDAREGGRLRISLTYDDPGRSGKTVAHTDTYRGRFVELVPGERLVEADAFETTDPALQGEMTITITLADAGDGRTRLSAVHENVPPGVSLAENELGWRDALSRLAAVVARPLD